MATVVEWVFAFIVASFATGFAFSALMDMVYGVSSNGFYFHLVHAIFGIPFALVFLLLPSVFIEKIVLRDRFRTLVGYALSGAFLGVAVMAAFFDTFHPFDASGLIVGTASGALGGALFYLMRVQFS